MDKSREKYSQATDRQQTHWLGLAIGLVGGLIIDALFNFRTGTFFTFIGIVLGMSGLLDFKQR
ncbi:hypothetical protein [Lentilactobacillus buchneri]|uniref:Uncharacterized protein n=1 Tax=Lentilactobacillus buchneri DSM 20057 TaxID=1423728 RepID=A0A4R5NLS6_LENBU|nr:hypothetical protein [Lentilactobacillus buchneri]WCJ50951.1 hypothetical protein OKF32_06465 [Lentilactobacillus sp. Egmn17]AEB74497.1 hypothetical protein Lbuc_2254 [Lentilactobacillus buchneri NRRL B-30929]KRK67691.1 hypothetical protein FC79_GL001458 [Lentilactobacillus buchneri DSM 20057]MCT2882337.1 hypothetical protein [Lentilactobacillus buchneri]MCT2899253.1 hypothetical protein [Lentilactobacillus buchneri]